MATLRIKFLATSIQMQMHLLVFLPESIARPNANGSSRLKVLWLLHDQGGDCSDWTRLSMVEHDAQRADIALVMPDMAHSMYMNMAHGGYPYFTYLSEDLPRHLRNLVQVLSDRREDNFVAGVGAGGYGALKWMLRSPQMFAACASLSGDVDRVAALQHKQAAGTLTDDWIAAFGDTTRLAGSPDDNLQLARQRAATGEAPAPAIHLAFSRHDESCQRDAQAARNLQQLGFVVREHEEATRLGWPYWSERIGDFIAKTVAAER